MWIKATNGECFNLAHFRRLFIQRGAQGSFDNKIHLTVVGEGNSYNDLAVISLHDASSEEAMSMMNTYLNDLMTALAEGKGYFELPQTGEW